MAKLELFVKDGHLCARSERYGQSKGYVYLAKIRKHRLGSADCVAPDEEQDKFINAIIERVNRWD